MPTYEMSEDDKEEFLSELDDIIDNLSAIKEQYNLPGTAASLIDQAIELLNKAQGSL